MLVRRQPVGLGLLGLCARLLQSALAGDHALLGLVERRRGVGFALQLPALPRRVLPTAGKAPVQRLGRFHPPRQGVAPRLIGGDPLGQAGDVRLTLRDRGTCLRNGGRGGLPRLLLARLCRDETLPLAIEPSQRGLRLMGQGALPIDVAG